MSSNAGRLSDHTFTTPPHTQSAALCAEAPCTSTTILHSLSVLVALLILGLTTQDAGLCSLGLNPFFAMLTIAYHAVVLALVYINNSDCEAYESPPDSQKSSSKKHELHPLISSCIACLLSLAWLGAYIAMAVVLATRALVLPMPAIVIGDTLFKGNALVYTSHKTTFQFGTVQMAIPQTSRVNQKLQMMFSAVLCALLGDIAIRGFLERVRACRGRGEVLV